MVNSNDSFIAEAHVKIQAKLRHSQRCKTEGLKKKQGAYSVREQGKEQKETECLNVYMGYLGWKNTARRSQTEHKIHEMMQNNTRSDKT